MTTYTIAPHKDGYKIVATWTEQQAVSSSTRYGFRPVAHTSVAYVCKTLPEAEKEIARLQARAARRAA